MIFLQPIPDLPDPLEAGWQGQPVCEVLAENAQLRALKCTFPPGVGHEEHFHAPHFGYTLQGSKMQITEDGETRVVDVPTGAAWTDEVVTSHTVLNVGQTTGVYLIIEPKDAPK